jgi:hypothetical protein
MLLRPSRAFARLFAPLALFGAVGPLAPSPAEACGGFFCQQVPVDQTGEQIIFGLDDGQITAQILINYAGEAEDFAWLLPVASRPEITLGTMTAFQNLGWRTAPTWNLEWQGGECNFFWAFPGMADSEASAGGGNDDRDVTVVARKDVGPFETVVLESGSTDDLISWLDDNDYDQPAESRPLIDHYVRQGMLFVALRLKKDEPTGAIQPITLKFEEPNPCVPLVLTQIAASPDMPVQLYLVSDTRVVPENWLHVTVNEKKIDWLNSGSNYPDLVTQAVNEASGRAFVTEYAGTSSILKELIYREGQYNLAALSTLEDPAAFVMALLNQGFPRDATMQALLRKHIPMPASLVEQGITEQEFYNNLEGFQEALEGFDFKPEAFVADLEDRIVKPLRDTQALFDSKPYLSRLFTTVSPDEMTRDPIFVENPDLPDVSNVRTAKAVTACGENPNDPPEAVIITLSSGEELTITGPFQQTWPEITYPEVATDEPAAARIELMTDSGPPTVVDPSQVEAVDKALDSKTPNAVIIDLETGIIPPAPKPQPEARVSGGCRGAPGDPVGGILGILAVVGIFVMIWRNRRRR